MPAAPTQPNVPRASLVSTDKDIIDRAAGLLPGAIVTPRPSKQTHHKDQWRVEWRGPRAVALMRLVRPLMGARRQAAIDRAEATYRPKVATRLAVELGVVPEALTHA